MRVYTVGNNIKLKEMRLFNIYPQPRKEIPKKEVLNSIKDVAVCKVFKEFEQAQAYARSISTEEVFTEINEKPAIFTVEIDDSVYNAAENKLLTCWESEGGRAKYLNHESHTDFIRGLNMKPSEDKPSLPYREIPYENLTFIFAEISETFRTYDLSRPEEKPCLVM